MVTTAFVALFAALSSLVHVAPIRESPQDVGGLRELGDERATMDPGMFDRMLAHFGGKCPGM